MAITITKKTLSPFVVELSTEPTSDALLQAENAGNVTVYTGNTKDDTPANATIVGSGLRGALKVVAAGATYTTDPAHGVWTGSAITVSETNITLQSLSVKSAVYGGALALDMKGKIATKYIPGVSAVVRHDVSLALMNTNASVVYGGGAGYGAVVKGDVSISYFGGNVSKIYGGGSTGAVVNGNVSIFVDGRSTGKIGSIYAGGYNSVVEGNATITFTNNSGLYNNLSLGTVYGGGSGKASRVDGTSTLAFDNYSGKFKAAIKDFDQVTISGKSSVILVRGQDKTMKGATFEFVINEDTFGLQGAMLTWNSKVLFSNVVVSVETDDAIDATLIQSKYFKTAADFSIDSVLVKNEDGEKLSTYAYKLTYNYDKKLGGSVSISYKGLYLVFDGTEAKKVVLSGAADEVNVVAGGKLALGLNTAGGNDVIRLQSGSTVNGGIQAGTGDDSLYIQKGAVLTGEVAMGDGEDTVSVESGAEVSSNVSLGAGVNTLTVQRGASMTGTIIFANGSTNTVVVNGAVMDFAGGDATTNNTITLNGDTVKGGGVGYWAQIDDNSNGYWTKLDVFVVRDLVLTGEANDTVIVGNGASVNNIYLGGGNDKLIINQGANIGYDYVSAANWTTRGNVVPATINLGTGKDVLVLNTQLGRNVNVITADDGGDVIVIGADMEIEDNQLLVGSTNNTLVVQNGRQVRFDDVVSWGDFTSNGSKYDAFYLSQNAMINFRGGSVIENYTGTLTRTNGVILVIGAPAAAPAEIAPYYTAGNGVTGSSLYAETVDLADGGKITGSKVIAGDVYVHGGTSIDNSAAGFVSAADYLLVSNNASVSGKIYLGYEPTHEESSSATADIAGTVGAIVGGTEGDQVNVTSGTAKIGSIDLGAGEDTVAFSSGTFADANLVIANTEVIVLGNGADVTVGNATGYGVVTLGQNSKFTEVVTKTVTIGAWDKALSFADGYTVRLNGKVSADVTLNNNTVLITANANYFAEDINLNGANTFSIQNGVQDWYDWQQFKFGVGATLGFKLGDESFFALDGFVGPTATAASIVASTEFGQNSGLGLGDWVYTQDWNGEFNIATFQNIFGNEAHAPSLVFENLNVVAGAKIYGHIQMDDANNQVVISDGAVINGSTDFYDYAAILTEGGDDTVTVGAATINGRIQTGTGDDLVVLNGSTINTAINQAVPAVDLAEGDDEIALVGATVNGSVAFGSGDDLLTSTGTSAVTGDIIFGADDNTVKVIGGTLTAGGISFDGAAVNNTIEVETGATFNVQTPVVLSAQNSNTVEIDGGTFGVDDLLTLQGMENTVTLSNGGHIAGLGDLTMLGATNTLELADSATSQTADTVNMTGSINLVENAGTLTATDSVEMIAGGLNRIVNSATGSIQADSLAMVGSITDTTVGAAATDLIENEGSLTAGSVLLAANSITLNNEGTVSVGDLMANGGIVTDAFGYQITGNTQILVGNAEGASLVASGDVKLYSSFNSLTNAGSVQTGDLLMAGNDAFITGISDTFGASNVNHLDNLNTGILNTGDLSVFGTLNSISNEGVQTAGDVLMAGQTVIDLTDGSVDSNPAASNTVTDFGTMTVGSLAMAGSVNQIALAGLSGTDNVGGTLVVTGDLVMGEEIGSQSGVFNISPATSNAIDLSTTNAAGVVQTAAVTAALSVGDVMMIGSTNVINTTAVYDGSVGAGAMNGRTLQVGAVSQSVVADDLSMDATANQINYQVVGVADGEYTTGLHLESRLDLAAISQTLDADVLMHGTANDVRLGITLTSTEEGNLTTAGVAVNTAGTIAMEGANNMLTATVGLLAGTQSVLDLQGDVVITVDSDISMSGNGSNVIAFLGTLTKTPAALPGESGGVINLNGHEAKVVVNSDITMVGTHAVNSLSIGSNTWYTGSVTMGQVYGDDLSALNVLTADVSHIKFDSLSMTAVTNQATLNGEGTVDIVVGIFGGTNTFTVGKGVDVLTPITFQSVIDADKIGTEGYTILENTSNTAVVFGSAGGIDSSSTNADDTFQVSGGRITGDILTGSSATGDFVTIGGGVTQPAWNAGFFNDRHASVVDGNVVMGTLKSVGGNNLHVESAIVLDADGNEVGFGARVGGDVTMLSTASNGLTVTGADTTPDIDENFTRFAADIGGSLTMTGSDNFADLFKGSIGGGITATAAVTLNRFSLAEFTVVGNSVFNAVTGNFVTAAVSKMADVDMTAVNVNTIQLAGSAVEDITMTATDGFNTATAWRSTTGSITMTAKKVAADAADVYNRLDLSGEVTIPADLTQEAPTVSRTTVTGDVTMTALTENTLRLGLEDTGKSSHSNFGSVTITGALVMAALANTVSVWAGTQTSYVDGPEAGTALDLRALVGSVAMDGQTNSLTVNQGALGVTTGGVTLANLDKDGKVIAGATNVVTIDKDAMLILEENALGGRQAISLGNANVELGIHTTSGEYGDVDYTSVSRDANGYETYYYEWKDTSTTTPDIAAATGSNTVSVSGKIFAGDLTMTGRTNIISIVGPATQDPDQATLSGYDFNVAELNVGDVAMYGATNTIVLTSMIGYNAAFVADSLTMGDIVVDYDTDTVKILTQNNQLLASTNTWVSIDGVTMTATTLNNIDIADYRRLSSADAPDLLALDGNKLVANLGPYSGGNPYIKAIDDTTTNSLGDVTMAANGVYNNLGVVTADGSNSLDLGQNSKASDVTMTAYTNTLTLAGDTQATYYKVDPVTGAAVMDGVNQKTEIVTLQGAATVDDVVFHLPAGMAGATPANTMNMGAGSSAGSVTSTDTWTDLSGAHGATDAIFMGERAGIGGNVDLGYGNDGITMGLNAVIGGNVDLGYGNDGITMGQDSRISGNVDLGYGDDNVAMGSGARISGNVNFGDGDDALSLNNSTVVGSVAFGAGSDVLTGIGTVGAVTAADLRISGSISLGTNDMTGSSSTATLVGGLTLAADDVTGFNRIVLDYSAGYSGINTANVNNWDVLENLSNLDLIVNSVNFGTQTLITAQDNFQVIGGVTGNIDLTVNHGGISETISLAWNGVNAFTNATAVDGKYWSLTGINTNTLTLAATV